MRAARELRIFRETATPDLYVVAADSASETVPANSTPSFATSIPVQPGDVIGMRTGSDVQLSHAGNPGDFVAPVLGDPALGQTTGPGGDTGLLHRQPVPGQRRRHANVARPAGAHPRDTRRRQRRFRPTRRSPRAPSGKTKKKSATFAFSGTDARAVASFQCKLDGGLLRELHVAEDLLRAQEGLPHLRGPSGGRRRQRRPDARQPLLEDQEEKKKK